MGTFTIVFWSLLLLENVLQGLSGEHSLIYIYTSLSKPLMLPGIYDFIALGMLNDRELDYYNSEKQVKVPKQMWMQQNMQDDYWEKGTQSRKSKEQWFKVNVEILMERMRHNKSDLHVLQWRHGCVVNEDGAGNIGYVKGIDEYSYDGKEFLSFDEENMRWIAPVHAAEETKRKWDDVAILNQYTKSYLEKECVSWLTKFLGYGKEEVKKHSKPDLYIFMTRSVMNPSKMTLTCMATGFYPPDVELLVRKSRTSLPEHMLTSSGVRPNGDGTYQLRKSVDIDEEEKNLYQCYVRHSSLKEPYITPMHEDDLKCKECSVISPSIIGGVIGMLIMLAVAAVVCFFLIKKKIIKFGSGRGLNSIPSTDPGNNGASGSSSDSGQGSSDNSPASSQIKLDEENIAMIPNDVNNQAVKGNNGASGSSSDSGQGSSDNSPASSQIRLDEENIAMIPNDDNNQGGEADEV